MLFEALTLHCSTNSVVRSGVSAARPADIWQAPAGRATRKFQYIGMPA